MRREPHFSNQSLRSNVYITKNPKQLSSFDKTLHNRVSFHKTLRRKVFSLLWSMPDLRPHTASHVRERLYATHSRRAIHVGCVSKCSTLRAYRRVLSGMKAHNRTQQMHALRRVYPCVV